MTDNAFLIRNAEVFDGTGAPGCYADVLIRNGVIDAILPCGQKSNIKSLDANGLALAPGFIDVHSHSDTDILSVPSAQNKLVQGVTTDVNGNCGFDEFATGDSLNIAGYAKQINELHPGINIATLAGHNTLRSIVMGKDCERPATDEEIRKMRLLLHQALQKGAAGFSAGLWYSSGIYSHTDEVQQLAEELKGTGKPFTIHIRSEGDTLLESLEEAFAIAKSGDNILQISHFKTWEKQNWHKLPEALKMIRQAKESGMDIAADRYPYLYAGTGLRMCAPAPYRQMERMTVHDLMKHSETERNKLKQLLHQQPPNCGWDRILLSASGEKSHKQFLGKTFPEIASLTGETVEELFVRILAEAEEPVVMTGVLCQQNLDKILSLEWVMPGSDAGVQELSENNGHPRKFGTMARFYDLAKRTAPEEQVIRRMTALPAERFHLGNRGKILPGYAADLVIFDKNNFHADENYGDPANQVKGLKAVFVNGFPAFADGVFSDIRSGRFVPVINRSFSEVF